MVKIISFGGKSGSEKNSSKGNPLKSVWGSFQSLDKYGKFFILTALLVIVATPFIASNLLEVRQRAQSPSKQEIVPSQQNQNNEANTAALNENSMIFTASDKSGAIRIKATGQQILTLLLQYYKDANRWILSKVIDDRPRPSPYDSRWHWHFLESSVESSDITIEVCQTPLADIEKNITYWITLSAGCIDVKINDIESLALADKLVLIGTIKSYSAGGFPYYLLPDDNIPIDYRPKVLLNSQNINLGNYLNKRVVVKGLTGLNNDSPKKITLGVTDITENPSQDTDRDGFSNFTELFVGTDPNKACASGPADIDATKPGNPSKTWPPDLYTNGASYNKLTIQDITSFTAPIRRLDSNMKDPNYDYRWDLVTIFDSPTLISGLDINAVYETPFPMLNNQKGLNLTCPTL